MTRKRPGRAGLERFVGLGLHLLIINAHVHQRTAKRPRRSADGGAGDWHKKEPADQHAPEGARNRGCRRRMHELIEFHPAVFVASGDDRIADLDQVLLLHSEDLIAHFLGLLFILERYENEIAHRQSPWTPAAWGQAILRLFCDDLASAAQPQILGLATEGAP